MNQLCQCQLMALSVLVVWAVAGIAGTGPFLFGSVFR
jgi:hypothetical protein